MSVLVVAEKPSVARDIAKVLGASTRSEGYFSGAGWTVTWAIGHLVALAEPHEMNPAWKRWRLADLPLLPQSWPLVVADKTRSQFEIVRRLMVAADVRGIVCATDAGREGELIFRYIYEAAKTKKPVKRLWISSLTSDAIAAGFRSLQDGKAFDALADAARARSRADWLVGMNLSRVYSVLHDDNLSVGRVQTPTLAMIVERELEIRAFVPEDYLEVVATFAPPMAAGAATTANANAKRETYEGTYVKPGARGDDAKRLPASGEEATAIALRAKKGLASVESVDRQSRRLAPPQLYDLTELQRHANRLYGFTAHRTLQVAQTLYEQRKLLSYPRTDSRHLSKTIEATLPAVVAAIEAPYRELLAPGTGSRPLSARFVDDARVSDHHAIIPTQTRAPDDLPSDERKIYELVCRRLLSAWHGDHVYAVTTVTTSIVWNEDHDRYASVGTSVEEEGWKVLDVRTGAGKKGARGEPPEATLPAGLKAGLPRRVVDAKAVKKTTRPPPRLTDGTLLTAMETAGRTLDERELSQAMRERGLGTPATRASILETLLRREYIVRDGKVLQATDKGLALIAMVHAHVKSPAMTGEWEAKLGRIEKGEVHIDAFMEDIERYVREVVGAVASGAATEPETRARLGRPSVEGSAARASAARVAGPRDAARADPDASAPPESSREERTSRESIRDASPSRRPRSTDLDVLLESSFGFASFRPYQRAVCEAAASGQDVVLVMPTGAGKSLCYQLPGVARGGTTLVISPLIALMEDQVAQLVRRGFAAERIHSGRQRAESRAVCRAYLDGELDFLFIAPERLKVPGFPEMLARRKPTLIAIDEAHCISQWGHDFRPDYRMLGERLPLLRPAPVIALTATATPTVQDDIVTELRLGEPSRFIHGFRRTNIAVEVVERSPSERASVVARLVEDPKRRPAIVYAPTRKEAEQLARQLGGRISAAAYHAGLTSAVRDSVQTAFLGGTLDVIIATTAFGMGIDKADVRTVIHTALPATVEGYYQEIGRAGRDGAPSRAVLLHAYVDTKTHEFFFARDYPEPDVLAKLQRAIKGASPSDELRKRTRMKTDLFEKALEKLWVHGGALVDADDTVRPGTADWRSAYERQRAHKRDQLEKMRRYAETPSCRMLQLVAHFGDQNDSGAACGICDVCAPLLSVAQAFRAPTEDEQLAATRILDALHERDGRAVGQIHRDLFGESFDRRALDRLVGALVRAGSLSVVGDEFVKDGKAIAFQRLWLVRRDDAPSALRIAVTPEPGLSRARTGTKTASRGGKRVRAKTARARGETTEKATKPKRQRRSSSEPKPTGDGSPLESALRVWRTSEAKKRRVPAFRILSDRTLIGIALLRPSSEAQLLAVTGMGMAILERHGKALLALVGSAGGSPRDL